MRTACDNETRSASRTNRAGMSATASTVSEPPSTRAAQRRLQASVAAVSHERQADAREACEQDGREEDVRRVHDGQNERRSAEGNEHHTLTLGQKRERQRDQGRHEEEERGGHGQREEAEGGHLRSAEVDDDGLGGGGRGASGPRAEDSHPGRVGEDERKR